MTYGFLLMMLKATKCFVTVQTLRPRQDGRCFFLNENVWIPIKISLKFVSKDPINNNPALVQIMAWRRPGDKPLSEPMVVNLLTHICVCRPQWVKCTVMQLPLQLLLFGDVILYTKYYAADLVGIRRWGLKNLSYCTQIISRGRTPLSLILMYVK